MNKQMNTKALDNASPEMIQFLNCVVTSQNDTIQNLIKGLELTNTLRNET